MKLALVHLATSGSEPPLGIAYIASYLRKNGFNNTVIIERENIMKRLRKEKPDLVGISSMTYKFPEANALAGKIKAEFNIPVINGGCHISSIPQHLAESNFDVGVIGEGESTMLDLINLFESKGFDKTSLCKVKGIVFGKNIVTDRRELIEPLDSIPFPARDLLKMKEFYLLLRKGLFDTLGVYTTIITSRGCPYNCTFCYPRGFWRKVRLHSANYVVDEIKMLKDDYELDGIVIRDDLFIISKRRVKEIVNLLKKEKLDLKFSIIARANLITKDLVCILKSMNVASISFGLESGSDRILNYLKKGTVTVKQNKDALKLCKKYGIYTSSTFIIGSPNETVDDIKETMKLVSSKYLDDANVFQLTPLPATEIWDYAKSLGIVHDGIDFPYNELMVAGFKTNVLLNDKLSAEEWKKIYDEFQRVAREKRRESIKIELKNIKHMLNINFIKKFAGRWFALARH